MALIVWIMMIITSVVQYAVDGVREGSTSSSSVPLEVPPQILEEPKDEIVRKNDPLTLYCKATGNPPPTIVWYKADSETPLRDRDSRLQLPDGSLFFYRVRARDTGFYFCIAHSVTGTATPGGHLCSWLVSTGMKCVVFVLKGSVSIVIGGQSVKPRPSNCFDCSQVYLSREIRIPDSVGIILAVVEEASALPPFPDGGSSAGEVITVSVGGESLEERRPLRTHYLPEGGHEELITFLKEAIKNSLPSRRRPLRTHYLPEGGHEEIITFLRPIFLLKERPWKALHIPEGDDWRPSYLLKKVIETHLSPEGGDESVFVRMKKYDLIPILNFPLFLLFSYRRKEGLLLFNLPFLPCRFRQEGNRLIVTHVVPGDEGEYQCVVTNMADQRVSHAATLTVYVSARVGGVVKSMVGVSGHDVTLPCVATGVPEPQVTWRRIDGIVPVGRSSVGRDWSLTISRLVTEDQGVYVCEATNQAGSHAANTSLLVVEAPRVDGGVRPRIAVITPTHVRKISCPVVATPTPMVFWVKENHPREAGAPYAGGQDENQWAYPGGQPRILVGEESSLQRAPSSSSSASSSSSSSTSSRSSSTDAFVDEADNLHVTSEEEGHWACMASNEVRGLMLPVHVVGGGVARGSVSMGIVGVDEVEARAALLNPTLEQGHPAPTSSRSATLAWRLTGRPTHMEGLFILGCQRGFGYVPLRVQQQLQTHDITRHRLHHHLDAHQRVLPPPRESRRHPEREGDAASEDWMEILSSPPLNDMDPDLVPTIPGNTSQQGPTTEDIPAPPKCSDLRILGYTLIQSRNTYTVEDLEPYTSYWFLLLPHYKGVLGVPSNMQAFTTPQDVPSGWVVLSRWWAAKADDGFYALTLHWRPLTPHQAHGIITKYQVIVHESDTGLKHNVSVVGDLTSLTLANVTSSRVSVTLSAATVKGMGPSSPPARLNLLTTHFKETAAGTGVVRSAWFIMLAGGAIAMVLVVVACTIVAKWCARRIHTSIPSETSKNKMCGVVEPWSEVGGLWAAAVEVDRLNSDKSERKLLASTGSSTADYAEVEEGTAKIKDELSKSRLDAWSQGLLNSSPSPSRSSANTHRTNIMTQSYTRHTQGRTYANSGATHTTNNTSRDSNCDTWYTGECCSCCHENIKLMVPPSDAFCSTSSGMTTVLANPRRDSHSPYKSLSRITSTVRLGQTPEAVTAYCETAHSDHDEHEDIHRPTAQHIPSQETRQLRLNTESTTDLSMDNYNFSDEDEDETQSCSDTEASFFIPHDHLMKGDSRTSSSTGRERKSTVDSSYEDIQRPIRERLRSSSVTMADKMPSTFRRVLGEERMVKTEGDRKPSSSAKGSKKNTDSGSTSGISSSSPLVAECSESSPARKMSSRSSASQDSLEEQFERTLSMISQGGSCNLDSDYLSTSAYN
ncbi:roundabout homolog 1-like [Macrobrachium rosenbergii]|uniref:roundabout homolog 1-like n=1 Tax=Macrobrachium rosenbergii TaxID=79674 RepID=UPI0034D4ECD2